MRCILFRVECGLIGGGDRRPISRTKTRLPGTAIARNTADRSVAEKSLGCRYSVRAHIYMCPTQQKYVSGQDYAKPADRVAIGGLVGWLSLSSCRVFPLVRPLL
jgi:hypothetical protein